MISARAITSMTISGSAIRRYGDDDILNISSCTPKSMYQYATAMRSEIAKPVSFPCFTRNIDSGSVMSVRQKQAAESTNFFVSSAFACLVADVVVVIPETTAVTLSRWLPITIFKTPQLGEAPFYPTLYWHESKHTDPANQWLRSIIIAQAKKNFGK